MNILIVGLGSIAKRHIVAIRNLKVKSEIYALRSKNFKENRSEIKNIFDISETKVKFSFAIISNPTYLHFQYIETLSNLGIPLFIEKPVGHNTIKADFLSSIIKEKNIKTYVACNMRFHSSIQYLKKYIDSKKIIINEVNVYCGSYLPEWRINKDFRESYSSQSRMGGGVHLDLIHEIDYCIWLFGQPKKIISIKRSVSSLKINSIDSAQFNLFYDTFMINILLNYFRRDAKREIEIVTNNDTILIDLIKNKVKKHSLKNDLFCENFDIQHTYNNQMKYFVKCITKNQPLMNDFDEGLQTLKLVLDE